MGSKSKMNLMKSYKNIQNEATPKKIKKENALDIISKSPQKKQKCKLSERFGQAIINL